MAIKDRASLPESAKALAIPVANQIEALGFKWTYDPLYPLPDIDEAGALRLQIRNASHQAPAAEVSRYKEVLDRKEQMPPGVVTKDGRFVDFNTRAKAARKLGWPTYPAFILDVSFEKATDSERERVLMLGAALNMKAARRLDHDELSNVIRICAKDPDWTAERVAKHLGVSSGTVSNIFAEHKAEERAKQLGISFNGSVSSSNKQALGRRQKDLDDQPWRELALITRDAGLTTTELNALIKSIQGQKSETDKIALIEAERQVRENQIAHLRAYGKPKPPLSVELRKRIAFIISHNGNIRELIDPNPHTRHDYLEKIESASLTLRRLVEAQKEENLKG